MFRRFRYPLKPTAAQAATLESWRIACQQLYNGALQERRDAWSRAKVSVTFYDQSAGLTNLRRSDPEWRSMPREVGISALVRLDRAFDGFYRRVKAGDKPGYPRFKSRHPRFKSRHQYGSIGFGNEFKVGDGIVHLPKLGPVKFHEYRPIKGTIKGSDVFRDGGRWYISFVCDIGDAPPKIVPSVQVGIDLGLKHFATLSTGEQIENPRFFKKAEDKLARRKRSHARKARGSKARLAAKHSVDAVYRQIRNRRFDHARKLAANLFNRFDLIAHERLSIARMAQGPLSKDIYDVAWGVFLHALACKAESAGKWCVPVNPHGTSQRCSGCGEHVPKTLKEQHACACGTVLDRDHNAALNVLLLVPAASRELKSVESHRDSTKRKARLGHGRLLPNFPDAIVTREIAQ